MEGFRYEGQVTGGEAYKELQQNEHACSDQRDERDPSLLSLFSNLLNHTSLCRCIQCVVRSLSCPCPVLILFLSWDQRPQALCPQADCQPASGMLRSRVCP